MIIHDNGPWRYDLSSPDVVAARALPALFSRNSRTVPPGIPTARSWRSGKSLTGTQQTDSRLRRTRAGTITASSGDQDQHPVPEAPAPNDEKLHRPPSKSEDVEACQKICSSPAGAAFSSARLLVIVIIMQLENTLGRVHTNARKLAHGRLPCLRICNDLNLAHSMPLGAVHTNTSIRSGAPTRVSRTDAACYILHPDRENGGHLGV